MRTTIRYILLTALRDWLFIGLFVAIFIAFGVSAFLGGTAITEENQMTTTFISGSTRLILLVGLIVFVCFHVRRAFDNREIEVIISRPISRTEFVFAYWLGFAVVSLIPVIILTIAIGVYSGILSDSIKPSIDASFVGLTPASSKLIGLIYWGISLAMETFFVVAFALFSSLILRSAVTSVLLCFGFYIISRMMGFFLYVLQKPYLFNNFKFGAMMEKLLFSVSTILPRLDLFSKSKWLIYGVANDTAYLTFIPQTLIYVPLLLLAAIFDFKRKQF